MLFRVGLSVPRSLFALCACNHSSSFVANHPNRNWKRRWIVDPSTGTAVHESGLTTHFRKLPSGDWYVETANGPQTVAALTEAGESHAQVVVERWIWESNELLRRALARRASTSQ